MKIKSTQLDTVKQAISACLAFRNFLPCGDRTEGFYGNVPLWYIPFILCYFSLGVFLIGES